jgi:hypothetical protein
LDEGDGAPDEDDDDDDDDDDDEGATVFRSISVVYVDFE